MDTRAYLRVQNVESENMYWLYSCREKPYSPLYPVMKVGGILFPYTPTLTGVGGSADYEDFHAVHSNYRQPVYMKSQVNDINLNAEFTASTDFEARYMLSVLWFCSAITKSSFGERSSPDFPTSYDGDGASIRQTAGMPPPVLKFSYMGTHMYNDVPVVLTSYTYDFPNTVDYVTVAVNPEKPEEKTQVPTLMTLSLTLKPYYNPRELQRKFSLQDFANGDLTNPRYL